jgi:exonuclease VII small subunit
MLTLEAFENKLESKRKFSSEHEDGGTYSSQELLDRLETVIDELEKGEMRADKAVRYFPRGQLRKAFKEVLKTEWFDVVSERFGYEPDSKDFYLKHKPSKQNTTLPYQGYKLRITAEPREAREVAEAVLEPLRQMGEFHKVVPNVEKLQGMQGSSQEGKFITVYPEVSEEKVLKNGKQRFTQGSKSDLNEVSVNANHRSTEAVIKNIEKALRQSSMSLNGGSIPPTDVRYNNTRISYRYGIVVPSNGIFLNGGSPTGNLVDVNGNLVEDNRSSRGADNWRSLNGRKELR